jgi:amino acid transporter
MNVSSSTSASTGTLQRRIGLRSAVLFNMLEMIGVGPFITLPLVIAAAGYRLSVWAWVLGAVIAVADGLVWAELGAAFPQGRRLLRLSCAKSTAPSARATGSAFSTCGR